MQEATNIQEATHIQEVSFLPLNGTKNLGMYYVKVTLQFRNYVCKAVAFENTLRPILMVREINQIFL
jgi:hypothetical protein